MGWLHGWSDRASLIKHLTTAEKGAAPNTIFETLAYCVRGNVLWKVVVISDVDASGTKKENNRFIECDLLSRGGGEWGYKDIQESSGPYYFTCPISYLRMVPCPGNESALKWRAEVVKQNDASRSHAGSFLVFEKPVQFSDGNQYVAVKRAEGRRRVYRGLELREGTQQLVETFGLRSISASRLSEATACDEEEARTAVIRNLTA